MRKALWIILAIAIVVAVILGISATDLWDYIIDLTRIAFKFLTNWIINVVEAVKEALLEAVSDTDEEVFISLLRF